MTGSEFGDGADVSDPPARHGVEVEVPLPRRAGQAHLAPQLRSAGAAPAGTAFPAFDDGADERRDPAPPAQRSGDLAADAVDARRRARAAATGGPAAER